jgi:hypothetical protein
MLISAGDDDEQGRRLLRCQSFKPKQFWATMQPDLNNLLVASRAQLKSDAMSANHVSLDSKPFPSANNTPLNFVQERRAMQEARLARLGKRKREPSPEPVLFNPGQGSPDAWQLGESPNDFVRRLPPLTTSIIRLRLDMGP